MSWITRDFECGDCGTRFDKLVRRSEDTGVTACECGGSATKALSLPNALHVSYHDGKDRGDTYRKLKEAASLEREAMGMAPEKRGDHNKKVKELKKI